MIDFGERPNYTPAETAYYARYLNSNNKMKRASYSRSLEADELPKIKTEVTQGGLHLARAVSLSTARYAVEKKKAIDGGLGEGNGKGKVQQQIFNAMREDLYGSLYLVGLLKLATTLEDERGNLIASSAPGIQVSPDTRKDPVGQAENFLDALALANAAGSYIDDDPSGFSLVRDVIEAREENKHLEMDGIPEQSFVLEGFKDVSEWYKAVYILGYRAGLGPAPRLIDTDES